MGEFFRCFFIIKTDKCLSRISRLLNTERLPINNYKMFVYVHSFFCIKFYLIFIIIKYIINIFIIIVNVISLYSYPKFNSFT